MPVNQNLNPKRPYFITEIEDPSLHPKTSRSKLVKSPDSGVPRFSKVPKIPKGIDSLQRNIKNLNFRPRTSRGQKNRVVHDRPIMLIRNKIKPQDENFDWGKRRSTWNRRKDYTNKELDGVAPTRIGMMLKALNKPNPADGEEIITPEEAQELLEKARKKLIDLKADELKALKNIAQQSPDYKFEDVNLLPNENKKLDRALDGNEINMEQLRKSKTAYLLGCNIQIRCRSQ